MRVETVKCDVCGRQKQETNHWYQMLIRQDEMAIYCFGKVPETREDVIDLCGSECVQRKVNEFLGGAK